MIPALDESLPISPNARCQEASIHSKEQYIACGRHAVAVVHHDKDRRGYLMCAPCADHNVRHRGGKLVRIRKEHAWRLPHWVGEPENPVPVDD